MPLPPNDPILMIAAWALFLLSLYSMAALLRMPPGEARERPGFPAYLVPLGFGCFAARWLMIGYGVLSPQGWGGRLMYLLAACGIVGGVAASRIRRMHDSEPPQD